MSGEHSDSSSETTRAGGKGMTGEAEQRGMQPMSMVQPVTPPPAPPPPPGDAQSARPK